MALTEAGERLDERGEAPAGSPLTLGVDPRRGAQLRRMKRIAGGLLAGAAVVFLATFALPDRAAVGFLRAAAEAGMVGGLADWFAVTALFRRPLGLPIPHTALIPTRKDALAATLGEFVTGHFLTRETVRSRLADARLVPRIGAWLAAPANAETVSREAARAASALLEALRPDDLAAVALEAARRDLAHRPYAPMVGRLLADVTGGGTHRPLVDVIVSRTHVWLVENRQDLVPHLKALIEKGGALAWVWATDNRVGNLLDAAVRLAGEVEGDKDHELRRTFDRLLQGLADDLQHDTSTAERMDAMVRRFLDAPATAQWLSRYAAGTLSSARGALAEHGSALAQRLARSLADLGDRAVHDEEFQRRLEAGLERAVLHAVDNYAEELTRLIQDTVARWDGRATAGHIELAAGKDLQFIRINGTLVGALAGIVIHAVAITLD